MFCSHAVVWRILHDWPWIMDMWESDLDGPSNFEKNWSELCTKRIKICRVWQDGADERWWVQQRNRPAGDTGNLSIYDSVDCNCMDSLGARNFPRDEGFVKWEVLCQTWVHWRFHLRFTIGVTLNYTVYLTTNEPGTYFERLMLKVEGWRRWYHKRL
jgi:hypothetical protein